MKNSSLLWSIQPPGNAPVSYLFGTMHLLRADLKEALDLLEPFLKKCQSFALEIDPSDLPKMSDLANLLEKPFSLSGFFAPKKWQKMETSMKRYFQMKIRHFENILPVFTISELSKRIFQDKGSIFYPDQYLFEKATQLHLEIRGLETLEEDLSAIKNISVKSQVDALKEILLNVRKFKRQLKKSENLYLESKLVSLYKSAKKGMGDQKKSLLYDRNQIMAGRILDISSEKALFAAVGAAHLPGKKGILKILIENNCRVKPVNFELSTLKKLA